MERGEGRGWGGGQVLDYTLATPVLPRLLPPMSSCETSRANSLQKADTPAAITLERGHTVATPPKDTVWHCIEHPRKN